MAEPETVYSSKYEPDVTSARDVLAFVLTPVAAFCPDDDAARDEIAAMLTKAKAHAVTTWYEHAAERRRS